MFDKKQVSSNPIQYVDINKSKEITFAEEGTYEILIYIERN